MGARQRAEWISRTRASHTEIDLPVPDHPVWIDGDPLLLDELLGNLIDNSLRYGVPRGCITLAIGENPPSLTVEDDDPGIVPDERDASSRPFIVHHRPSPMVLAIVHEIAHAHGAWWKLISRPEFNGTRLTVVFPGPRKGDQLTRHERSHESDR